MSSFRVFIYFASLVLAFVLTEARSVKYATDGPLVECQANSDCDRIDGSCVNGECVCPTGKWFDSFNQACVKVDPPTRTIKPNRISIYEVVSWIIGLATILVILLCVCLTVLFHCGCISCAWLADCFGCGPFELPEPPPEKKKNQKPYKSTEPKSEGSSEEASSGGTETGDELKTFSKYHQPKWLQGPSTKTSHT